MWDNAKTLPGWNKRTNATRHPCGNLKNYPERPLKSAGHIRIIVRGSIKDWNECQRCDKVPHSTNSQITGFVTKSERFHTSEMFCKIRAKQDVYSCARVVLNCKITRSLKERIFCHTRPKRIWACVIWCIGLYKRCHFRLYLLIAGIKLRQGLFQALSTQK